MKLFFCPTANSRQLLTWLVILVMVVPKEKTMCGSSNIKPMKILTGAMSLGLTTMADDAARDAKRDADKMARDNKNANDATIAELSKPKPEMMDPVVDADTKAKRLRALRFGLSSTIKTTPMGVTAAPGKTKLGQ